MSSAVDSMLPSGTVTLSCQALQTDATYSEGFSSASTGSASRCVARSDRIRLDRSVPVTSPYGASAAVQPARICPSGKPRSALGKLALLATPGDQSLAPQRLPVGCQFRFRRDWSYTWSSRPAVSHSGRALLSHEGTQPEIAVSSGAL